jgi:FkbM family methyltransferase
VTQERTTAGHGWLEPPLLAAKWAIFHLLCRGELNRYLALRGRIVKLASAWGLYERAHLKFLAGYLRPGDTAIDVGANLGAYSLAMSRAVGAAGQVLAFEPIDEVYRQLQFNCRGLANVRCFNLALSDREEAEAKMQVPLLFGSIPEPSLASLRLMEISFVKKSAPRSVRVTRLDACLGEVTGVRFIKADIEGQELAFLRGAVRSLARFRPLVQVEVIDMASVLGSWEEFAAANGYRLCRLGRNGRLETLEPGVGIREINFYLAPREAAA